MSMDTVWMCVKCRSRHFVDAVSDADAMIVKLRCPCGARNNRKRTIAYDIRNNQRKIVQQRQLDRVLHR